MISMIIEIAATVIDIVFMIWFISRFHGFSVKKKPIVLIWAIGYLGYQLFIDWFNHSFDLLPILGVLLFAGGFSFTLERKQILRSIFAALLYVIVIMLSGSLVYSVFSMVFEEIDVTIYGSNSYHRILYILIAKLIHWSLYRLLLFLFQKDRTFDWKNALLSFVFTLATALGLGFLMKFAVDNKNPNHDLTIIILAALFLFLNLILYVMIYEIQLLLKKQYDLRLMHERMLFEKSRVEDATAIWSNIHQVKHDLKNHFAVLSGYLREGNIDSCQEYVSKLHTTVETMGCLIQSGNSVIDYLINSKLAHLEGVTVLVSGYVGNYSDIEDIDLACILGNILDNAIEAQEKLASEKRIELLFLHRKSSRIIICKNTIDKSVLQNNKEMKSTKDSPELHGIGHQIVETTVKKYSGLIDYFEDGEMFGVQIVLPDTPALAEQIK